jgi:hypothetical protein
MLSAQNKGNRNNQTATHLFSVALAFITKKVFVVAKPKRRFFSVGLVITWFKKCLRL